MLQKFILLVLFTLVASCSQKKASPEESPKPLLLVSISPYRFLVEQIAGPDFEVRAVVPLASNPHSFEPTASQVNDMSKGQIWFYIGESFEKKISPILKSRNPSMTMQDLREGIQLIETGPSLSCKECCMDHLDRHIWLSPKLANSQAFLIEQKLSAQFPEKKELFEKNFANLSTRLTALDQEIQEILKPVQKRTILVSHPAFGYFCKEYNFEQLSIEYEGKDPRPKHIEEILNKAVMQSMELALALPQYNNKGAQLIAEKLHMPVRLIDPYSSDYIETMRKLAHLIADPYAN
jgi:zinc transport system substrate-binding protein